MEQSTQSSPSVCLVEIDHELESHLEPTRPQSQPQSKSIADLPSNPSRKIMDSFISPGLREDLVAQSDVASLKELIQREFEKLQVQTLTTKTAPNPPSSSPQPTSVVSAVLTGIWPQSEAWVILLVAIAIGVLLLSSSARLNELSAQTPRSALEQETQKLHSENQALWAALNRVENESRLRTELCAAKQELQKVSMERQGLWEERQSLWEERAGLWAERADLWRERQSLWDERGDLWNVRDKLIEQVKSLEG